MICSYQRLAWNVPSGSSLRFHACLPPLHLLFPSVQHRLPLLGLSAKFIHNCPNDAFQIALPGPTYSFLRTIGAIVLFAVGTTSSLVGTTITNALINAWKAVDESSLCEEENVPILSTSAAYGVYTAISRNLSDHRCDQATDVGAVASPSQGWLAQCALRSGIPVVG
ncbi:hypothetical protein MLD38_003416 [Melastoma candidum]|uniref:Uncharacterized protein n=1 Tax=Melastoma candidum TaxID=119954 RepID=A0ACB9S3U7_9MYRT|nr:hypothetical protein MLD38_003416 [Melastoma candidum]